jgi:hypothetical protein
MAKSKYWEQETPQVVDTGRNVLRYFEKAGRVQISMPYWTDDNGEQKPGKTVALDLEAVQLTPAAARLIRRIADNLTEE